MTILKFFGIFALVFAVVVVLLLLLFAIDGLGWLAALCDPRNWLNIRKQNVERQRRFRNKVNPGGSAETKPDSKD